MCRVRVRVRVRVNQPQNRNFDRQLWKHPTVFEYAHDYLDNRLTKWLGAQNEKAPNRANVDLPVSIPSFHDNVQKKQTFPVVFHIAKILSQVVIPFTFV